MPAFTVPVDDFHWREVEDRLLVLHVPTSRYVQLNSTATVLWEAVVNGADEEELEATLMNRYDIEAERARTDVAAFLGSLRQAGFLVDES